MTDEDLMDVFRLDANQPEGHGAYDKLYQKWRARIFAYHLMMLRNNSTAAEELTQETFCRVIDKRHLFDRNRGTFSVWLYSLAANLKRDFVRYLKHRATAALDDLLETAGDSPPLDLRILLDECLNGLSGLDRQIIYLTTIEGFTFAEASRILDIPPGTLGRRQATALRKLQAAVVKEPAFVNGVNLNP